MLFAYQKELKGENIGVVFGSFSPLHQGHLDLIMRAKKENDGGCIVIVCGFDGDKGEPLMPHKKRYRYVREFFADDDLVAVYAINDTELGIAKYPNGWDKWLTEFNRIYDLAVESKNAKRNWYVGEADYYDGLTKRGENAILIDRTENLISGTMIRQNPIKHWDKIYLLCPKGVFVDDHSRFMIHAGMEERQQLFEILCDNIKRTGNWDKVTILDGGYWKNFERIVKDVKEIIENGKY